MKKYAIAFISFFDNENKLYIVEAENKVEALRQILPGVEGSTVKELQQWAFNTDCSVSCPIEVPYSTALKLPQQPTTGDEDENNMEKY